MAVRNWHDLCNRGGRLFFAAAIVLLGWFARELRGTGDPAQENMVPENDSHVLSSSPAFDRITGFGGPVPVKISIDPATGRIESVEFPPNAEDPDFWKKVIDSGVLEKYSGLTPAEAAALPVDAVTGATFSSRAAQETVRELLLSAVSARQAEMPERTAARFPWEIWLAAAVFLIDLVAFFRPPGGRLRLVQLGANVVFPGIAAHCFLSFAQVAGWLRNAPHWGWSVAIVLFIVSIGLGVGTGRNFYCTGVCPYGSAQELAARLGRRCGLRTVPLSSRWMPYLRRVLAGAGILAALLAWPFRPFEPFSLFLAGTSPVIVTVGVLFLAAALRLPRLWCRWFCPCGALLDFFCRADVRQTKGMKP